MNIISSSDMPVGEKKKLNGWDDEVFKFLSSMNKKACAKAARLHKTEYRKDGKAYLVHINRSLSYLKSYRNSVPEWVNIEILTLYIILHDCIEDHPDGLSDIYKHFGAEILKSVLWMSAPKIKVLNQLDKFLIENTGEKENFQDLPFWKISQIIHKNTPEDIWTIEELHELLPYWEWISLWESGFQKRYIESYDASDEISEKQKNVFADWVFQGMVYKMPEVEFLAKSFERLDNLRDTDGLQDEKWMASYRKTIFTTKNTYLVRLNHLKIDSLRLAMDTELDISKPYIQKITQETKSRVNISFTEDE